jgi:transglutaminase-like putative cysteine protease
MKSEKISLPHLIGITCCLGLALAAHVSSLPPWVLATIVLCAAIRLTLGLRNGGLPPRWLLMTVSGLAISLLWLRFRTFTGLAAGTALLALMAGLKLLETRLKRDFYIITLIIFFLCVAALLNSESFWLLGYLIGTAWLTALTLLRVTTTQPAPNWLLSLRFSGRLLLQALPLMLILWLLFPRLSSPLWNFGVGSHSAESGLSDSLNPGDITELAMTDDVAFRVRFATQPPPPLEQYWRGPVLHDFDGRVWRHSLGLPARNRPATLQPEGRAYKYTINLEPHQHTWVYTLDWPSEWNLQGAGLTGDYTLVEAYPVSRPIDVTATSYTHVRTAAPLSREARYRDTQLPEDRNPRARALSAQLRSEHPDDLGLVQAVLDMFSKQAFYYTLTPPALGAESVDDFLFNTRRGFCGHYASAFATLMRGAGIPARIVTGYQGGTYNRFANYWIVQQNRAHAWVEVWMEPRGWVRIDPTSAINPSRVEASVNDAVGADEPLADHWQRRSGWFGDAWLRLDQLRDLWREQIITFNQDSQERLLVKLHVPEPDGQKLVLVLSGALSLVFLWLTWQLKRELNPSSPDKLARSYHRLCAKLAAAGLARHAYEGAEAYGARVASLRPDLGAAVTALCRQYSLLRYARHAAPPTLSQFQAAVRAFRVRPGRVRRPGSPGSSRS